MYDVGAENLQDNSKLVILFLNKIKVLNIFSFPLLNSNRIKL